jgi:glucokinase
MVTLTHPPLRPDDQPGPTGDLVLPLRVGIDIGGSTIYGVVVDGEGRVLAESSRVTGWGNEAVEEGAVASVEALAAMLGRPVAELGSVGVGVPGLVDPGSGRVRNAVNIGVVELDLAARLHVRLGLRVAVDNDVNAAALGAWQWLGEHGGETLAFLNLGTGIAAGFVVDGRPWRGSRGYAGEIGHLPALDNHVLCPCGQTGCLETVASGTGLARLWPTADGHAAHDLVRAVDRGDAQAIEVWTEFVEATAIAVQVLALAVDPAKIVIGGGLSQLGSRLATSLAEVLTAREATSSFLTSLDLGARLTLIDPAFPQGAVGAALLTGVQETV